jgi:DNA ligase (NAD+)
MGEKSAANIIRSIEESKDIQYHRVLFALGIRHVGETVAKKLSLKFRSLEELMEADIIELTSLHEIGPKIATSIISYFSDQENIEIIRRLTVAGLHLKSESADNFSGDSLRGKTIVISGVFKVHSREEYKEIIEKNGGKNSSSISTNTSFVLAGDDMGPSKKARANDLGIRIVNEDEFLQIVGEI